MQEKNETHAKPLNSLTAINSQLACWRRGTAYTRQKSNRGFSAKINLTAMLSFYVWQHRTPF